MVVCVNLECYIIRKTSLLNLTKRLKLGNSQNRPNDIAHYAISLIPEISLPS